MSQEDQVSSHRVKEIKPILDDILRDLSLQIYLKDHKLRYQEEQKLRYLESSKVFLGTKYMIQNKTLEEFVEDYNCFLK
jgi:hypothetical protein